MKPDTVIFDMDGLLIDSEPLWQEAAHEVLQTFGIRLTEAQYSSTTGLRTKEFLAWWFGYYHIPTRDLEEVDESITQKVIQKVKEKGAAMPGVDYIFPFFSDRGFKIGLATSSPFSLIDIVVQKLKIQKFLHEVASAQDLQHGKPHPQVYLNCADSLHSPPVRCICFEDSFNGMIAVKAARMKCVIIPAPQQHHETRWDAADFKLASLGDFKDDTLATI